jgi:anti-sigma factor RsiW
MSACDDKTLLITALLDGELDAANTAAIEQHIKTCAGCAKALADGQLVRTALSSPGAAYTAPEAFRRRLKIALAAEAKGTAPVRMRQRDRTGFGWLRLGWASGGAIAAALGAVLFVGVQAPSASLADELVSDHVRSMLAEHLMDVPTSDRHTVKPWFDGKVSFAPTVIDFAAKGFPLAGGRLDYVQNQRAAAIVFRRRLHVINVFVWPVSPTHGLAFDQKRNGYNLVHWTSGGLNYWAVSDVDAAELKQFRDLYVAALKT